MCIFVDHTAPPLNCRHRPRGPGDYRHTQYMYIHTYIHICMYVYIHVYRHIYIYTYMQTNIHTNITTLLL